MCVGVAVSQVSALHWVCVAVELGSLSYARMMSLLGAEGGMLSHVC